MLFLFGIAKPCTHLHPASSTSTRLHPPLPAPSTSFKLHPPPPSSIHLHQAPSTSTQFIPASTQLSGTPSTLLEPNIAFSRAISPNTGRKIESCSFWLKIGTHGILEVLILDSDLDFWNSEPKIHFYLNLGWKSQSCPFCLKIGIHGISKMLIVTLTLAFWISKSEFIFEQLWVEKFKD